MKDITKMKPKKIKLEKYGITVRPYLLNSEISAITSVVTNEKTYASRNMLMDCLILNVVTNIEKETSEIIEEYDDYILSGLMSEVKGNINNFDELTKSIEYEISVDKNIIEIKEALNKLLDSTTKAIKKVTKVLPKNEKGWEKIISSIAK